MFKPSPPKEKPAFGLPTDQYVNTENSPCKYRELSPEQEHHTLLFSKAGSTGPLSVIHPSTSSSRLTTHTGS